MKTEHLTTEDIRKKFKNNFDLCNFSIQVARTMIMGGNPTTLTEILAAIDRQATEARRTEQ